MSRCLDDVDDEVRDRAALYIRSMREEPLAKVYLKEGMLNKTDVSYLSVSHYFQNPFHLSRHSNPNSSPM